MTESTQGLLRIRVIKRFDAGNSVVTEDLPHLHQTTITSVGMQPGNPGSTALGSFTIKLHPPGTEGYAAAKPIYDQLKRYMRVEFYPSHDAASAGKLVPGSGGAGVITGIRKSFDAASSYELTGASDLALANLSRPFPGELLSNAVTSAMLKSYLGTNELGWSDTFKPYTAGNYTSTFEPSGGVGNWAGTTDDSFNVVSCSSGTNPVLISKTGAIAGDRWNTQFVEVTGRLKPSNDTANGGIVGVGLTKSNANVNDSVQCYVVAVTNSGRINLSGAIVSYAAGVPTTRTITAQLLNVDDPDGFVPLTLGLLLTTGGNSTGAANATMTVNGKPVIGQFLTGYDPGTVTQYPFLKFSVPSTGTATAYLTNLVQFTRFTTDGTSTAAAFGNGTINTSTHSIAYGVDPGPSLLETWTRLATREGWYWRYTPKTYTVGTRTLGTVDFAADPGTDLTTSVIFSRRNGNLVGLQLNNNADALAADTALSGQSTPDGGGIAIHRDISTLGTYGVIQDEALSFTHSDFNTLRRAAFQVNANKIALDTLGAKTATVLRDPQIADIYRELDKVTIDDPEMGVNNLAVRIMARIFTEGSPTETLVLDQFSETFSLSETFSPDRPREARPI